MTYDLPNFVLNSKEILRIDEKKRDEFKRLLEFSKNDPNGFWESIASDLVWRKKWDTVMEGRLPEFSFFKGGYLNVAENLIDRHIEAGEANRAALIFESETGRSAVYTYAMLQSIVNKLSNALRSLGVKKGDRVSIFLPNIPETLFSVLACYRVGAVFNTIFSGFSTQALENRLKHFNPMIIITADGTYRRGKLVELKKKVDEIRDSNFEKIIVVKNVGLNLNFTERDLDFYSLIAKFNDKDKGGDVEANEPGIVFYTSGTTGKPKGVVLSGAGFLVNNYVYAKHHLDLSKSDVLWCTADIGWLTMHIWGIIGALANGSTTLFYEGAIDYPSQDRFYEIVQKYKVTKIFTAPTLIRMLMKYGFPEGKYDVSSVRVIGLVGEPLNPEAWHWMNKHFRSAYINNTWGQTETAGTPLAGSAFATGMKPGSSGIEFLGASLDVVDDEGNPVLERPGNLVIKKPFPMMIRDLWNEHERFLKEYYGKLEGLYFTYDVAVKDKDGHFWVLGRNDDVINVSGHRLSTMEMESLVASVNGIAECAVVGIPDEIRGLTPVVFVSLKNDISATGIEETISKMIEEGIGKFAAPSDVIVVEEMPKTPSGKILRRFLREIYVYGDIVGDRTGLENPASIEKLKSVLRNRIESRNK
ncbi:acetyl-CoA synthetase [Thermoplasma volcanium GSS1]|uniref:acetate--CoA ligase n=1 Tax=Thermoplasma volcanium (strain ATCC 51530 / DSM 4299 / JCM 9571 / NBRC 15438 / GSS1) TaxID=273116 RepID=Q978X5_THEVO|nr:acetate--CoA ligase [Thermoplasma volcanium]BAB60431.1 acetyl-CoA synthetase [Thermoplasma volcanium GSS1]